MVVTGTRRAKTLAELFEGARRKFAASRSRTRLDDGWFDTVAMFLVDAIVDTDHETTSVATTFFASLGALEGRIDAETWGRCRGLGDVARWAEERRGSAGGAGLEPRTHAARMLLTIVQQPGVSNSELAANLDIDPTEVSRTAAKLKNDGLITLRRLGRRNAWEVTPKGAEASRGVAEKGMEVVTATAPGSAVEPYLDSVVSAVQLPAAALATAMMKFIASSGRPTRDLEVLVRDPSGELLPSVSQVRVAVSETSAEPDLVAGLNEMLLTAIMPHLGRQPQTTRAPAANPSVVKRPNRAPWSVMSPGAEAKPFRTREQAVQHAAQLEASGRRAEIVKRFPVRQPALAAAGSGPHAE